MTKIKELFSENDRGLIEAAQFDSSLEPRFNALSATLVWEDEIPSNITPDAYDVLSSLWVARSLMHRGLTFADHPINPEASQRIWEQAVLEIPNWPGFKRLALSEKERVFYEQMLAEENPLE